MCEISYISKEHGRGRQAQGYALFNMAYSGGFLVGPIWGGLLVKKKGWNIMITSLTAVAIAGFPPVLAWTGGPLKWSRKAPEKTQQSIEDRELKE